MSDEQGHPLADTPAPGTEAAPQTQTADSATPQGTPDDSAEKRLRDKDEYIGRLGKELGDLRTELASYRQMMAQAQGFGPAAPPSPGMGFQQPSPTPQGTGEKFDWDDPLRSVDTRLERKLSDFAAQMTVNQSFNMAQFAEATARQADPALFNEVGDQVRNVMIQGIRSRTVDPRVVSDPEMWKTMAWVALGQKRGYKLGNQVNPLSPTVTEAPTGSRPSDADANVALSAADRELIRKWGDGINEKDVIKGIQDERKRRG